jgi:hypothetical protein
MVKATCAIAVGAPGNATSTIGTLEHLGME